MKCEQFRANLYSLLDTDVIGNDMITHSKECYECGFLFREFLAMNHLIENERRIEVPPYADTRMLSIIRQWEQGRVTRSYTVWRPALLSLGVIAAILAGITIGFQGQRFSDFGKRDDPGLQEMRNDLNASDVTEEDVINLE